MKKKKTNLKLISIIITIILILIVLIIFIFFNPLIKIKLIGKDETIEVFTKYKDKGVKIEGTKNKVKITNQVNTNKLGTYTITYKITHLKTTKIIKRKIKVVDTTKPEITLQGNEVTIYQNDTYNEPGYTATDNYDKDITSKVKVTNNIDNTKAGTYEVTYSVSDSSKNKTEIKRKVNVIEKPKTQGTYIKGILIVNKKYSLPANYNPGVDQTASTALKQLQQAASTAGHNIPLISGFRSYSRQQTLYNNYVARDGQALADTYSARPGQSEHQTGLAFDVGKLDDNYGSTPAGIWLKENCHKYGFILRYPKGKESITGYQYEPWHIRYVGVEHATKIMNQNITLEEYLNA